MTHLIRLFATWFYTGNLPFIPGTWGSAAAAIIWWYLPENLILQITLILVVCVAGIFISDKYSRLTNTSDPSEVVIDEVAGMWISLFIIPHSLIYYLIAFFIFRLLDITKPGFIDSMQDYDGGLGIMMDDIAAVIITFFAIVAIRLVF